MCKYAVPNIKTSNLESGNVRGSENDGTITVNGFTWYYKNIHFKNERSSYPFIVTGRQFNADTSIVTGDCYAKSVTKSGFTLVFSNNSGNSYYGWAVVK